MYLTFSKSLVWGIHNLGSVFWQYTCFLALGHLVIWVLLNDWENPGISCPHYKEVTFRYLVCLSSGVVRKPFSLFSSMRVRIGWKRCTIAILLFTFTYWAAQLGHSIFEPLWILNVILVYILCIRGLADFFCEGQDSKYFRFCNFLLQLLSSLIHLYLLVVWKLL